VGEGKGIHPDSANAAKVTMLIVMPFTGHLLFKNMAKIFFLNPDICLPPFVRKVSDNSS